jgi:L-malate glycosyltransferase
MTRPFHVLVIPSWYPSAGTPMRGSFFREQADALVAAGARVGVAYAEFRSLRQISLRALRASRFQFESQVEAGIPTVRCSGWNLPGRALPIASAWVGAALVRRYVREFEAPDAIHVQGTMWAGLAALRTKYPFVVSEHSSAFLSRALRPWEERLVARVFRGARRATAVSTTLARALAQSASGRQVEVVPNSVDLDLFHPPVSVPDSPPTRFLAVGHLNAIKGYDLLLKAFSLAFGANDQARLTIAGDGPELRRLMQLRDELGLSSVVELLGALSRSAVAEELARSHVLVVSSLHETFCVAAVEALASGVPVLATRCGGPGDIVTSQVGWLVQKGDERALAGGLVQAHEEWGLIDRTEVRRRAVEQYSRHAVAERTLALLRHAAESLTC